MMRQVAVLLCVAFGKLFNETKKKNTHTHTWNRSTKMIRFEQVSDFSFLFYVYSHLVCLFTCESPLFAAISLVYSLPALHRVSYYYFFIFFSFVFFLFACSHSCVFVSTVNTQLYPHREMTYSFYNLFHRLNAGRNSLMWHSLSTAPTVHLDSTPTRNSSACCSTCATKTVAVSPTCAALELLSISSTASAIGFTTLTARKPTSGTNTY